nr:hypothetical protein Itr_chr12CG21420 [Ipomoea trifida]
MTANTSSNNQPIVIKTALRRSSISCQGRSDPFRLRKLQQNAHCSAPPDAADGLTPATYVAGDRISSALHACDFGSSPAFNTPSSPRLLTGEVRRLRTVQV